MSPQHTLVLYLVVPLWLVAGFADWICHRSSHIEDTSGAKESVFHLLLLAEMGAPLLAAIYFDVNTLILGLLAAGCLAHELTTHADLRFASARRSISVPEQMVHSVLEMLPLTTLLLFASAYWQQWLALFGLGHEAPRLGLAWSVHAPPIEYGFALAAAICALAVGPYIEELLRSKRKERRTPELHRK